MIVMTEQDPKYRSERTGTVGYGVDMRIKAAVQRHYNASPWVLFRWTPTPVKLSDQTAAQAVEWVRAQGIEIPDSMEKHCTEKVIGYYVLRTMVEVEQDPGYVSPWENRTWAEFETQVGQAVDTYYK